MFEKKTKCFLDWRRRVIVSKMSLVVRKLAFCICENKDADQLRGNREADQRLCFRYTDSTIPLLARSKVSCLKTSSVTEQPGLCQTWSETPKTGFLRTRLKLYHIGSTCRIHHSKRTSFFLHKTCTGAHCRFSQVHSALFYHTNV